VKSVRYLLLCILSFAIPLQGMAAVSQMFCHGSAAVAVDHSHHHQAGSAADKVKAEPKQSHQCSSCAKCCVGIALLPAKPNLSLEQPGSTQLEFLVALSSEVAPSQLERPPRLFLV
jgi:hypothetical protein